MTPPLRSLAIATIATGAALALLVTLLVRDAGDLDPRRPSVMELDEPAPAPAPFVRP